MPAFIFWDGSLMLVTWVGSGAIVNRGYYDILFYKLVFEPSFLFDANNYFGIKKGKHSLSEEVMRYLGVWGDNRLQPKQICRCQPLFSRRGRFL